MSGTCVCGHHALRHSMGRICLERSCDCAASRPMTPAVPDSMVEARIATVLDDHRRGESSNDCLEGVGWVWACFCECGWHGRDRDHDAHLAAELAPLLAARAAAPDALRVAVEALAAEWDAECEHDASAQCKGCAALRRAARMLRALLEETQ